MSGEGGALHQLTLLSLSTNSITKGKRPVSSTTKPANIPTDRIIEMKPFSTPTATGAGATRGLVSEGSAMDINQPRGGWNYTSSTRSLKIVKCGEY